MQLRVGDVFGFLFRFALPDDGGLLAARLEMAVEAVDGDVELAVLEKCVFDLPRGGVPDVLAGDAGLRETLDLVREGRELVEYCATELDAVSQGLEELRLDELVTRLETGAGSR